MSEPRFASLVVTYHRPVPLRRTLEAIVGQTRPPSKVLVFDNGRDPATAATVRELADRGAVYFSPAHNLGPAGALHDGMSRLVDEGFDLVHYTGDGEPPVPDTLFAERLARLAAEDRDDVGCIAGYGLRWDWSRGRRILLPADELRTGELVEADLIAAAQPIFTRRSVLAGGLPNRRLFWGFEDYEQSLLIRRAGLRILVDPETAREARTVRVGQRPPRLTRLVPRLPYRSLWRRYYLTRNIVYSMRNTFERPDLARREAFKQLAVSPFAFTRGLRYGLRRGHYVVQGVIDGYRGRLGPRFLPDLVEGSYEETFERAPEDAGQDAFGDGNDR